MLSKSEVRHRESLQNYMDQQILYSDSGSITERVAVGFMASDKNVPALFDFDHFNWLIKLLDPSKSSSLT